MVDRPVLALYRRYRPDTFAAVIGQEHVITPLTAAIEKGRVNHAYLFSGPRGCGKTTSARVLARSLNCAQGPTPTPCEVCDSCVDLARGGPGSLDVIEIDAASHRGIDDARDLRDRVTFAPIRDRYKVVIIDEAHQITNEGFNALLKVVEEPPEHVVFVFATTEPEKVLGTIRSRTHHFPFRLVPPRQLMPYLELLCREEGVAVAPGALTLVMRAGGGSVRDTLSVLDQLVAGAGPGGVDLDVASDLLGYVPEGLLDDIVDALAALDGAAAFGVVQRAVDGGHDPRRFAHDLLERFRALVVVSRVGDGAADLLPDQVPEAVERFATQAGRFGAAELSRAADTIAVALSDMAGATSSRLLLELLVARLLVVTSESEAIVAARLERLERQLAALVSGVAAAPGTPLVAHPVDAAAADRGVTDPGVTDPGVTDPGVTDPGVTDPGVTDRGVADPGVTDRGVTDPGVTSPRESAGPVVASPVGPAARPPRVTPPDLAAPQRPAPTDAPLSPTGATVPPAVQSAGGLSIEVLRRSWDSVCDALRDLKRLTWSLVSENATVLSLDERTLTLGFATQGLTDTFNNRGHGAVVREALISALALDRTVVAVHGPRSATTSHTTQTRISEPASTRRPFEAPAAAQPGRQPADGRDRAHDQVPAREQALDREPPSEFDREPDPEFDPGPDHAPDRRPRPRAAELDRNRAGSVRSPDSHVESDPDRHDSIDLTDGAQGAALLERVLGGRIIGEE